MFRRFGIALAACVGLLAAAPGAAQRALDRADPAIVEQVLPKPDLTPPAPSEPRLSIDLSALDWVRAAPVADRIASAIVIDGAPAIPRAAFADAVVADVGRNLDQAALAKLASRVAAVARARGYALATALIAPQPMRDGVLRITLDEGRIDAVRVIGTINPQADRILTRALVTHRGVRRAELERAIQLVGDVPGITVKESRYIRQDGFGILLVTVAYDRASAYVQLDNRGSKEVGPVRATELASIRGILQSGDELALIAAQTPLQPSEFAFLRARYSAPADTHGSILSVSASYGRAEPGAALGSLDVIGHSVDVSVDYTRPLYRSRQRSLWGNLELRGLKTDQTLLGIGLRDDRIATATGTLNGDLQVGHGTLRGEVHMVGGLPLDGVTHQGDLRASRGDGDARFVSWGYSFDWARRLGRGFALVLASAGQLASRPLLATEELGLGGPAFGRAYDNAERTGDQGILGSAELRADLGRVVPHVVDRLQLYSFVDGGYVANLRGGFGGGSLLSAGGGARLGVGRLDGMIEVALPLNADRFDTRDRDPRLSFRLSRSF